MARTIVFGPFLGEFGWEMSYWQGWVRKICRDHARGWRRIAVSRPGRHPFYPDVDEFWPLPDWFLALGASGHGYITDGWLGGYPGRQSYRMIPGPSGPVTEQTAEEPLTTPDIAPLAERLVEELRGRLPSDALILAPWRMNVGPDGLEFGFRLAPGATSAADPEQRETLRIPFSAQDLGPIRSTPRGRAVLDALHPAGRPLVAVFPRSRAVRRPDKNWSRGRYLRLIQALQQAMPDHAVAVLGEPGGAYFDDGVPPGCLDLITVDPDLRMDVQVAALERAAMALGGISGALLVALATACPVITWGYPWYQVRAYQENYLGTPFYYIADMQPDPADVMVVADRLRPVVDGRWHTLFRARLTP